MQTYVLPCNWKIAMPDNWQGEYVDEDGQYVFYPDNSDLTIRITPFHAERDGVLAPAEVMENAYVNSISTSAISRSISPYNLDGLCGKMYENTVIEENKTIYAIYVGYYTLGELLSISIWGTNKTECEQTLDILKTIKR